MTAGERYILLVCAQLMEYPDTGWFEDIPRLRADICHEAELRPYPARAGLLLEFLDNKSAMGLLAAQEEYVSVFDHDPSSCLYLAWHRYGNDRGQGKAMAALNGLYRSAGYEPVAGMMPDYLPVMLEFLALCEDWAAEALLDGFGAELAALNKNLKQMQSSYAPLLECALAPLRASWPRLFLPRSAPDATARPMAAPEPETALYCRVRQLNNTN